VIERAAAHSIVLPNLGGWFIGQGIHDARYKKLIEALALQPRRILKHMEQLEDVREPRFDFIPASVATDDDVLGHNTDPFGQHPALAMTTSVASAAMML
jgi:hypothetical protein